MLFADEGQAYMKYVIFTKKAEEEGIKNIAELFKAIAYAEQIHESNHLKK